MQSRAVMEVSRGGQLGLVPVRVTGYTAGSMTSGSDDYIFMVMV